MDSSIQPNQTSNSTTQFQYAGFWVRFFAFSFDSFLTYLFLIIFSFYFSSINPAWNFNQRFTILSLLVGFIYQLIFWVKDGATPGKKLFKLKIVKENYSREDLQRGLSLSTAIARYIGYLISGMFLYLGFLWIAFDKNKKGWHDKIAGTVVIRLDDKRRIGLRIIALLLFLLLLISGFIWGFTAAIKQKGKAGEVVIEKIISGQAEDLKFSFKKQREAYLAKLPSESRSLVEKSINLTREAETLIAGANCNIQVLNKNIESKLTEAVNLAKKAVELSPDNPYTHYNLAHVYNWSYCFPFGGDDKALLEYQKAVELDQNFIEAKIGVGNIFINLQNYKAAIPHFEYATQKAPLCGRCWLYLGEAYWRYGAKAKAKEALQTAKSLLKVNDPDRIEVESLLEELNK